MPSFSLFARCLQEPVLILFTLLALLAPWIHLSRQPLKQVLPRHTLWTACQNQHVPKVTITPPHLASSLSWDLHPSKATPALGKGEQPYPTAHPQQVQLGLSASSSRGWPHLPACLQQLQPHLSASHIGPIASPAHYCTCNSCSLSLQTAQLRASPTH